MNKSFKSFAHKIITSEVLQVVVVVIMCFIIFTALFKECTRDSIESVHNRDQKKKEKKKESSSLILYCLRGFSKSYL